MQSDIARQQTQSTQSPEALVLLAEAQLHHNRISEAFELYVQAVNASPSVLRYKERLLDLARRGIRVQHTKELEQAFAACLKTPELAGELENWSSLLLFSPDFRAACASTQCASPIDSALLMRPLLLEGLRNHVVCDPAFERFVTRLRSRLLCHLRDGPTPWPQEHVDLAAAIAHYAAMTDYILNETADERAQIDKLQTSIEMSGSARSPASIATLACYRPLHALRNADEILRTFANSPTLGLLVKEQIEDQVWIDATATAVRAETSVDDHGSMLVREQYEFFPYPQWKTLSKRSVLREWLLDGASQTAEGFLRYAPARILVAGCGTGRDAAIHALRFPTSSITAMDLSRTSLAYGLLRAKQLGLENITFVHGDILYIWHTTKMYDYVCCVGVLHHMDDPIQGWKALCAVLKSDGLMKIGLYSRTGRKAISRAQAVAANGRYSPTREGVLQFRSESERLLDAETAAGISRLKDYYNTGMYRDLLFPVQEHRFDLGQIKSALEALHLTFEGFHVSADVLASYRAVFPNDPGGKNLDYWQQYEAEHPHTFANMYIFWCRRNGSPTGATRDS
jgi:SAM-dependent methyltransferase